MIAFFCSLSTQLIYSFLSFFCFSFSPPPRFSVVSPWKNREGRGGGRGKEREREREGEVESEEESSFLFCFAPLLLYLSL